MTESVVRPCGAMRTSLVTSSPLDVFSVTVVMNSRGSVLSIVNGMRTDFAGDAERRRVEAEQLDVGQSLRAADRDREHRNLLEPQFCRGVDRRLALVPVAVGDQHDADKPADLLRRGGERRVEVAAAVALLAGERLQDHVEPFGQRRPCRLAAIAMRSRRGAEAGAAGLCGSTTSRVAMLAEASHSTAIAGFFGGPEFFDPFRLIEQQGNEGDDRQPQQFQCSDRATLAAAPPGDEAQRRRSRRQPRGMRQSSRARPSR